LTTPGKEAQRLPNTFVAPLRTSNTARSLWPALPALPALLSARPSLPQTAFLYVALSASLLAGASLAHAVLRPDLTLPPSTATSPPAAPHPAPSPSPAPAPAPAHK